MKLSQKPHLAYVETNEQRRLNESREKEIPWKKWGPYLSERQWGTVREDYSQDGNAWNYFSHDQARSRAYRWGEDGLAGISDDKQQLCFAIALWNGRDPILKERLFGLTNSEGNHGEDVKEYYFYLDSTPTHSYMKYLYKYPQAAYPYGTIVETNRRRGKQELEYELIDTGVFDDGRYFDVFVEYAKASPEDILVRITVENRGPEAATLHLLPTLWFRNVWAMRPDIRPRLRQAAAGEGGAVVAAIDPGLGNRFLYAEGQYAVVQAVLLLRRRSLALRARCRPVQSAAARPPQRALASHAQRRRRLDARQVGVSLVRRLGPRVPRPGADGGGRGLRQAAARPHAPRGLPPPQRPAPRLRVELRRRQPPGARVGDHLHVPPANAPARAGRRRVAGGPLRAPEGPLDGRPATPVRGNHLRGKARAEVSGLEAALRAIPRGSSGAEGAHPRSGPTGGGGPAPGGDPDRGEASPGALDHARREGVPEPLRHPFDLPPSRRAPVRVSHRWQG